MRLFKGNRVVVPVAEFRDQFRRDVLVIGDHRPTRGRPRHTALGDMRAQIDFAVASRLATSLVEKMEADGQVFEPASHDLYSKPFRDQEAWKWVTAMGRIDMGAASGGDHFETASRALGDLVPISKQRNPVTGRQRWVYVSTMGATPAEFRVVSSRLLNKAKIAQQQGNDVAQALAAVAAASMDGEAFEDVLARHYHSLRNGAV